MSSDDQRLTEMRQLAQELDRGQAPATAEFAPHEPLDQLDNVLKDSSVAPTTRRSLLKYAATGVAAAGGLGLVDPVSAAFAAASSGNNSPGHIATIAVTAEQFAVTYLGAVLERVKSHHIHVDRVVANVIRGAQLEEFDHYRFLERAGYRSLTKGRFYFAHSLFPDSQRGYAEIIDIAETLFINAYLIAITSFAKNGLVDYARYAGEILGVEAEHRALARLAMGASLPNERSFEAYHYKNIDDIVAALEDAGVGFGMRTKKGGNLYHYHGVGNDAAGLVVIDRRVDSTRLFGPGN
jgi:hypothetical protein